MEKKIEIKQEKPKDYDLKEDVHLVIKKITIKVDENEQIKQIRFQLTDSNSLPYDELTYKPSKFIENRKKVAGFSVIENDKELFTLDEIPKKLIKMNDYINENGKINVVCDYSIMKTLDKFNEPIEYAFLNNGQFTLLYALDKKGKLIDLGDEKRADTTETEFREEEEEEGEEEEEEE